MKLIRDFNELAADVRSGAITIGNFDGVHRGHARIVERLLVRARQVQGPAVVFTFDPHPVRLLRPEAAPPPLTWTDRKAKLLCELGVDAMVAYATDEPLLSLTPEQFFDQIVRQRLDARAMVEGPNFNFGRDREGNIELLSQLCLRHEVQLEIVEPLRVDGRYVSSSRVRQLLCVGNVAKATQLLTRPYRIRGMVTHGARRGAQLGFPTANVDAVDTLLPANGVYAGVAITPGRSWKAAINVGPCPTFGERATRVEAHLIGFRGSLYGQPLELDFLARLRDIRPFESVEALKQQLAQDVAAASRQQA